VFGIIVGVFGLMLVFVWLKIETNKTLGELSRLRNILAKNESDNKKYRVEIKRLKSLSHIQGVAQKQLGLNFLAREDVIKITP